MEFRKVEERADICALSVYIIKEDETGAVGGTHTEEEKCPQCYVGKPERKRAL